MRTMLIITGVLAGLTLGGCTMSRYDELKAESRRVAERLRAEQSVALVAPSTVRDQKLDHLTSLRYTLSAANVALASVPRFVPEEDRPVAYDVMEEVYATIDWNIPLMPTDDLRSLPAGFSSGRLDLDAAKSPSPGYGPAYVRPIAN
ncbi:MAG: hypothetical protein R3B49_02150 [Phycisphaerales bacterium]